MMNDYMLMYGNLTLKPKAGWVNRDTTQREALTG